MSAYASLLLAAAATAQPAYPVDAILDAFKEVCFSPKPYEELESDQQFAEWKQTAEGEGWVELTQASSSLVRSEEADYRAFYQFKGMDYAFISSMMGCCGETNPVGSGIFKKEVAGRAVYISIMATDGSNPSLSECRLYDPLGDGINSSPVSRPVLERWTGTDVKRRKGVYGGTVYDWKDANEWDRSIRVHFGYYRRSMENWGDTFTPYTNYGLTLVVSNYHLLILT